MSFMQAVLTAGLVTGIGIIMITLIGYITDLILKPWFSIFGFIILIVGIVWGSKLVREKCNGGSLTYGRGTGSGIMISLFTGTIVGIFAIILYKYIDPDLLVQIQTGKMLRSGVPEDQIEKSLESLAEYNTPLILFLSELIIYTFVGLIISLITSAIVKKEPVVNLFTETEE